MKKIAKWIRHNQGLTASIVICLALLIWTFGCESTVASILDPSKMVNAEQLDLEIESELARLNLEIDIFIRQGALLKDQLARLDERKRALFEFAKVSALSGGVSVEGLLVLVGLITGAGAVADNRIKDKVIKNRPVKV